MESADTVVSDGANLLNQSASKYNKYVNTYNAKRSDPNIFVGILVGTGILWLLSCLVVNPLAKFFSKREVALTTVNGYMPQVESGVFQKINRINTRTYILTDLIILGIAGFLMGRLIGWYFIGISWKIKHWPGLIAFIGMSFLGSFLYG